MDGQPTVRMGAGAVGPDQGADGSGVDQRLIPEEPMVMSAPIISKFLFNADPLPVHCFELGYIAYVILSHLIYGFLIHPP